MNWKLIIPFAVGLAVITVLFFPIVTFEVHSVITSHSGYYDCDSLEEYCTSQFSFTTTHHRHVDILIYKLLGWQEWEWGKRHT